jgi:heat shock protein beta
LPKYLSFIKGVIDSDDLPINVSRESLQQVKMLKVMGRKLTKKVLEMLKKFAEGKEDADESDEEEEEETDKSDKDTTQVTEKQKEKEKKIQEKKEKYLKFWKEFGKNIKLGIIEDATNRMKLTGLTRWYTSHNITELSSFDDYIKRMKPGQEHIYYIGGESKEALLKAPAIQKLLKKGYEVVLLDDPVDEFCMQNIYDFEKKTTINVGKGTFQMPGDDKLDAKKLKALKKHYEPLTNWWKELLKDKLDQITISERIADDPCIVVGSLYGFSAQMERVSKAQAYGPQNPMASSKRNLEINPGHPVIKELAQRVQNNPDKDTEEMAILLYEAALLNSGFPLSDPREFSNRFFKIFNPAMGISKDAMVEDIEVEIDENDDSPDVNTYSTPEGQNVREERTDNSIKMSFDEPPGFKEKQAEMKAKREAEEQAKAESEAKKADDEL